MIDENLLYRGLCTNRKCDATFGHWKEDAIPNFCPRCGSGVISACPSCQRPVAELIENPFTAPPNNCMICGEVLRLDLRAEGFSVIQAID